MTDEYFSSTGNLGVARRPDNRLYINTVRFNDDFTEVVRNFDRAVSLSDSFPDKLGRVVCRGLFSESTLERLLDSRLHQNIEVVTPMHEFGNDSYLVYLARNIAGRSALGDVAQIIEATHEDTYNASDPVTNVERIVGNDFNLTEIIEGDDIDQVHNLWHETFGWSRDDVTNFASRLATEASLSPDQRTVWFCGARDPEWRQIVSCAMAERIQIPGKQDSPVDLVESTEWCTDRRFRGQGLMSGVLTYLHTAALLDMQRSQNGAPLIYAECNFSTRSDIAGHNSGLRIPQRLLDIGSHTAQVPQILVQNVSVYDQLNSCSGGLKDFNFMCLPQPTAERLVENGGRL